MNDGPFASVHALVLTHDSPADLARCLGSIEAQIIRPIRVTVIDNGGSLPLSCPGAEMIRLEENTGPAGGWAAALQHFLSSGQSRAWLLDDDCEAERECLKMLLRSEAGIALPFHQPASGVGGYFPSWTGVLLTRSAVECLGLPRAEFFWWCEDTEYLQHRPKVRGVASEDVEGARVVNHATRRAAGQLPWKTYYEVRNSLYYRLHVQSGQPFARRIRKAVSTLLAIARRGWRAGSFMHQARALALGVAHGLAGRLGKTVDPDH